MQNEEFHYISNYLMGNSQLSNPKAFASVQEIALREGFLCVYVVRGGISDGVGNDPFLCMKVAPAQHLFWPFSRQQSKQFTPTCNKRPVQ